MPPKPQDNNAGLLLAMQQGIQAAVIAGIQAMQPAVVAEDPLFRAIKVKAGVTTLPNPVEMANASCLGDPLMWFILFNRANLTPLMLRTLHGTPGEYLLAFNIASRRQWPDATTEELETLSDVFVEAGFLYIFHPAANGPENLLMVTEAIRRRATKLIISLDTMKISVHAGTEASLAYKQARESLDPKLFGTAAEEAVKRAQQRAIRSRESGSSGNGGGGHSGSRHDEARSKKDCRRCKLPIKEANFAEHNKVCPKKRR